MTRKQLFGNVFAVMILFMLLIITAIAVRSYAKTTYWYDFIKDFSALFIAIGAAYLAYCFQQRQAFLFALRELWAEIVKAKTRVNYYIKHKHPNEKDYRKAYCSLSKAIDLVRGVYINVGENDKKIGLYPFEPLHDIRKCMEIITFVEVSANEKEACIAKIDDAWNALRFSFLREFDRPCAGYPITEHFARDPRRPQA